MKDTQLFIRKLEMNGNLFINSIQITLPKEQQAK